MGRTEHESAQVLIDYFKMPITVDDYVKFTEEGYIKHFPSSALLPGNKIHLQNSIQLEKLM